jgi:hypothetical protein
MEGEETGIGVEMAEFSGFCGINKSVGMIRVRVKSSVSSEPQRAREFGERK